MKKNVLIVLVSVFCCLFILMCGIAVYEEIKLEENLNANKDNFDESNNKKNEILENDQFIVYEVTDEFVINFLQTLNIMPMLDEEKILDLIYSGKDSIEVSQFNDKQKMYLALRNYIFQNDIIVNVCDEGEYYEISKKDLEGVFFEDSSYLDNITSSEDVLSGQYTYKIDGDDVKVCHSIYGFESPLRFATDLEVVSAYQKNDKFYLNSKFIYYNNVSANGSDELFYYDAYDVYNGNGKVIESFNESIYGGYVVDYSKFATYEFIFKVDGDNYYLESINRK